MAARLLVPLLWLRVGYDPLTCRWRRELTDRALHPIALTVGRYRGHLIIIGGLRLQIVDAYAENRLWMLSVEPDVIFRRLAQIFGICPIVHNPVMFVVAARVRGSPPDKGRVVMSQFELRTLGDLDVLSLLLGRKDLSDDRV